ncbi:Endonuclease/Exonuclease/phosphatase family protein [Stachybotrys elegans]|uniref:Endonuclease/Exonuclease/phosphatase family protein n=1 Tax=Stachybotrys elegans TaxID=80388 RepID=A0A8K0SIX8_9HYPO|nr:Endonuclease/Exonuclease/phosphatase family protein [Stachybotrys elegans]
MTQQFDLSTDGASRRAAIDDQDVLLPSTPMKPDLHTQATFMTLRIVTYNIRYATEHPVAGERHWDVRCPKLGAQLSFLTSGHENAFLCLQEGLHSQLQDIRAQLGDAWSYIGQGRDDGDKAGEHSPIFYRSQFWNCERTETRWLSETPAKPSRGWDASQNRIVTIGEFSHKMTGTRVVVMSTHFDDAGAKARQASAKLLINFANEWDRGHGQRDRPSVVLVAGDLNSTPDGGAYQAMTELGSGMFDISELVPESKRYGNYLTYTTFGEAGELPQRLDYLFIKEPRTAVVKSFGVLANSFDDQIRVSDHRPVVADMEITL